MSPELARQKSITICPVALTPVRLPSALTPLPEGEGHPRRRRKSAARQRGRRHRHRAACTPSGSRGHTNTESPSPRPPRNSPDAALYISDSDGPSCIS